MNGTVMKYIIKFLNLICFEFLIYPLARRWYGMDCVWKGSRPIPRTHFATATCGRVHIVLWEAKQQWRRRRRPTDQQTTKRKSLKVPTPPTCEREYAFFLISTSTPTRNTPLKAILNIIITNFTKERHSNFSLSLSLPFFQIPFWADGPRDFTEKAPKNTFHE